MKKCETETGERTILLLFRSEAIVDQVGQQSDLAFGKLVSKGRHPIAAIGYLVVDLGFGSKFEITNAKARDDLAVDRLAIALRAVTDGALLTK